MTDGRIVADASAVLALLQGEAFTGFEPSRLVGAHINAVNLSEVLAKLYQTGLTEASAIAATAALDLVVLAFDETLARDTARLRTRTRHAGLSLADCACLASAMRLHAPAVTADRVWQKLDIGVEVVAIR
ncbi:MAG: type II toxin-antitoxin system VapC family toxin [Alphaproteobacteria bacterium]